MIINDVNYTSKRCQKLSICFYEMFYLNFLSYKFFGFLQCFQSFRPGTSLVEDLCILAYTVSLPGLKGKSHRVLVVFGVDDELQVRESSHLRK